MSIGYAVTPLCLGLQPVFLPLDNSGSTRDGFGLYLRLVIGKADMNNQVPIETIGKVGGMWQWLG